MQEKLDNLVIYILEHLDQELSLAFLSELSGISTYYLHRQFTQRFGQPLHQFIQQCRLERAAVTLATRPFKSITEVALDSGYQYSESFARAISRAYGLSPKSLRQNKEKLLALVNEIYMKGKPEMKAKVNQAEFNVEIKQQPLVRVACYRHKGPAQTLMQSVQHFIVWRQANHTPPGVSRTFNFLYQDPRDCLPEDFQFDIGASTKVTVEDEHAGIFTQTIPPGKYAMLLVEGSDETMSEAVDYIYSSWLPDSGETPIDFPCIVERLQFYPEVAMHQQQFQIMVALEH